MAAMLTLGAVQNSCVAASGGPTSRETARDEATFENPFAGARVGDWMLLVGRMVKKDQAPPDPATLTAAERQYLADMERYELLFRIQEVGPESIQVRMFEFPCWHHGRTFTGGIHGVMQFPGGRTIPVLSWLDTLRLEFHGPEPLFEGREPRERGGMILEPPVAGELILKDQHVPVMEYGFQVPRNETLYSPDTLNRYGFGLSTIAQRTVISRIRFEERFTHFTGFEGVLEAEISKSGHDDVIEWEREPEGPLPRAIPAGTRLIRR
jgi:hypothetical protein